MIDQKTGRPRAGIAVRALPVGRASGSSGGLAKDAGPLTDAQGRYRITGLRAGSYTVQAHAAGRPPSRPAKVEVQAGQTASLNLSLPRARWIDLDLQGEVPAAPRFTIDLGSHRQSVTQHREGSFEHHIARERPPLLSKAGFYRLGPVGYGSFEVILRRPSRVRFGTGPRISLGFSDPAKGRRTVALPNLESSIVHGRIVLPREVPAERVAVLATRVNEGRRRAGDPLELPNVAGISSDGDFSFDLPAGGYVVQAVDLLTGIVFHSEESSIDSASPSEVTLRPRIRWLEIECRAIKAGDPVVLPLVRDRGPPRTQRHPRPADGMDERQRKAKRQRCVPPRSGQATLASSSAEAHGVGESNVRDAATHITRLADQGR